MHVCKAICVYLTKCETPNFSHDNALLLNDINLVLYIKTYLCTYLNNIERNLEIS